MIWMPPFDIVVKAIAPKYPDKFKLASYEAYVRQLVYQTICERCHTLLQVPGVIFVAAFPLSDRIEFSYHGFEGWREDDLLKVLKDLRGIKIEGIL